MSDRPHFAENDFRKASFSAPNENCVEVARGGGWVEVRDDKVAYGTPADHHLAFTAHEFDAFLTAVRRGEFGLTA
jgi:hypothetical protein